MTAAGILLMIVLAYFQNIAFSMVSRSRNHDHAGYHVICAIASNGVWFATFHYLVTKDMTWTLMIPYTFGTVSGSLTGSKVSLRIEQWLGLKKS